MKRTFMKTFGGMALAISLLTLFAAQKASSEQGGSGRLDGTWDVQLTVRNCQTGATIRTLPEVATFMFGGTMLYSTSGIPQSLKTPGHGNWRHVSGNNYEFEFKSLNFDAGGVFTGWTIVIHAATLNSEATGYISEGTAEVFNPNGTSIFKGCSTATATRL